MSSPSVETGKDSYMSEIVKGRILRRFLQESHPGYAWLGQSLLFLNVEGTFAYDG